MVKNFPRYLALTVTGLILLARVVHAYNPLSEPPSFKPLILDLSLHDTARNRDIPLRFYLPDSHLPAPVVLFSPGLGGNRAGSAYLGKHWSARGYVALYVQHPGSDDAVWKGIPTAKQAGSFRKAASVKNFYLRVQDIHTVLKQLSFFNRNPNTPLHGRLNLSKIGMSGHSFGAITTEAVSGENFPIIGQKLTDEHIKAAIAFSPSLPGVSSATNAMQKVAIPWMLMTGTKDISLVGHTDAADRLLLYPALHHAPKYEVILNNAEHSAFIDRSLHGDREPRNPNHHRVILALSTAFWDSYLMNHHSALQWLNGSGPQSVFEKKDRWHCSSH